MHSRFSTNTFPSWDRAHPYRCIAHNGEINTLRGNINWMRAREALFQSPVFGEDIKKIPPIVNPNGSDSSMFDNVLELMVLSGRSMPHAVMMMIPEPWSKHASMDPARRAFYQYHSSLMEPWDGPADISFTDGKRIGAVLDRNGLRPGRYYVTKDDLCVMASEAGVLEFPPEHIVRKGRLQPGRMFLVDTELGRIVEDEEIKAQIINERPYAEWLKQHLVHLKDLPAAPELPAPEPVALAKRQVVVRLHLRRPAHSHGADGARWRRRPWAPWATTRRWRRCLPEVAPAVRLLQAAVRAGDQPAHRLHPRRDHHVVGRVAGLGRQPAGSASRRLPPPRAQRARCSPTRSSPRCGASRCPASRWARCACCSAPSAARTAWSTPSEKMRAEARRMIEEDEVNILILSDRGVNKEYAADSVAAGRLGPASLLIRQGLRMKVSLALETGDAREVHHFALLIGYGCSVINPYLAFETLDGMIRDEMLPDVEHKLACKNFAKAAVKGVVKVMSKMGISAVQSYHGAQVFEAVGLRQDVIDEYFTGTASRVGGVGLDVIAREVLMRHTAAFAERKRAQQTELPSGGQYQWRADGEFHLFNPESIHRLQKSVRTNSYATYKSYAELIDDRAKNLSTLRGLLDFKQGESISIDEVESVESIMKRFKTGAMSYGSHFEGSARDARHRDEPHRRQVEHRRGWRGSGSLRADGERRLEELGHQAGGVGPLRRHQSNYLVNAKELQIKMAQGAKPGEGGQLPGTKVYPWIAKTRHTTAGVGLISPPPHHDIYSIEDLAELIHDLKNANRDARISVKLVAEVGVGTIAAGVAKAHADVVLISGYDGGTGASPLTSRDARGPALGAGPRRDAPDAGHQQSASPDRGRDRRSAEDRPRRGHRRLVGRRGIRLRHRAAGRRRLHHDARVPSEHLPGGRGHAGSAPAREVRRQARARGELHAFRRAAPARDHGAARLPQARRHGRPRRHARAQGRHRSLEGQGLRLQQHPVCAGRGPRDRPLPDRSRRITASTSRWT